MTDRIEIVPGESIGPFKLGMTRQQIEQMGLCPGAGSDRATAHYPMQDIEETGRPGACDYPPPGVNVHYDESDRCHRLDAVFCYLPRPPVFTLCGRVVNGMSGEEVTSLLQSMAEDVSRSYGSIYSLSTGIRAIKWEAGDEEIMCIEVMPKTLP